MTATQATLSERPVTLFTAVKAFVTYRDKILLLRESARYADGTQAGLYDVPGGRMTPGEAWDAALRREIAEECGLAVTIGRPFHVGEVRIDRDAARWQIVRIFFQCAAVSDDVRLGDDHDDFMWIGKDDLLSQPLIGNLRNVAQAYLHSESPT